MMLLEVYTTIDPTVFMQFFTIEGEKDFKLWAQAKGMYLSMRFMGEREMSSQRICSYSEKFYNS